MDHVQGESSNSPSFKFEYQVVLVAGLDALTAIQHPAETEPATEAVTGCGVTAACVPGAAV